MSAERCPECGGELASGGPFGGQCPRCVLELGLAAETPETIGPYRVLEVLGRGGMGVVYLAEQTEPVRRRVAVKVIRQGIASDQVLARFESERQALALMTHPNVARVHDVGEDADGRPYFAMEYIDGEPITDYCDRNRLTTEQRLQLLVQVCRGVQHAHQKGVVHRDLKPANVLVEEADGEPVPRIIDFGIAKAIDHREAARTAFTRMGQFVGTPEYMSPEQADLNSPDVDTRTDVYSLGVLLYELLIGALPLDARTLRELAFDEVCRRVREEQPSRPSARVATLETPAELAECRRTDATGLRNRLRGDLDWITMKALEKDRSRRYGSPEELASEIERHLNHEPVSAGPPSRSYRFRKFVRRHRLGVAASGVALAGLLVGAGAATWGLVRARTAEEVARRDARTAEEAVRFMEELFQVSDPGSARGEDVTAREMLDRGVERIEELKDQPLVQARLLHSMGKVYFGLGHFREAKELLERSREMRRELLGDDHVDTLRSADWIGSTLYRLGDYAGAEAVHRDALERARVSLGPDHETTLAIENGLGLDVWRQARFDEAETIFERSLATKRRVFGERDEYTLVAMSNLANVYMMQGRNDLSADVLKEAHALGVEVRGEDHPATLDSLHNYGMALARMGKLDEAEPVFLEVIEQRRRVLGDDHPRTLGSIFQLANVHASRGEYEEALALDREILAKRRASLGERHMDTLWSLSHLALTLQHLERFDEAERLTREALALREEVLGEDHPDTLTNLYELGLLHVRLGDLAEAERLYRERLERSRRATGEHSGWSLDAAADVGDVLLRQERYAEAAELLLPGLEAARGMKSGNPGIAAYHLGTLGRSLAAAGRGDAARPILEEARELLAGAESEGARRHLSSIEEALATHARTR